MVSSKFLKGAECLIDQTFQKREVIIIIISDFFQGSLRFLEQVPTCLSNFQQ